jgi:hypothetical protein
MSDVLHGWTGRVRRGAMGYIVRWLQVALEHRKKTKREGGYIERMGVHGGDGGGRRWMACMCG